MNQTISLRRKISSIYLLHWLLLILHANFVRCLLVVAVDRRSLLFRATSSVVPVWIAVVQPTWAANTSPAANDIRSARDTLQTLIDNWEKAVIDCTFADVPRELLETKNKAQLLEKAKVSALFDKSASVVSCKTTNRIVREYLGKTGKGPLVGLEKKLRTALDYIDPDQLENYAYATESIQQALARADTLSYAAGVADASSINNFDQSQVGNVLRLSNSNLEQTRQAIQDVVTGLNQLLNMMII